MQQKETIEHYLETILNLMEEGVLVRSIHIANRLHFSKPTVSVALKQLRAEGYLLMDEDGRIAFTVKGLRVAKDVSEKHRILYAALLRLGVDEETAKEDACKIEHVISEVSIEKIKNAIG